MDDLNTVSIELNPEETNLQVSAFVSADALFGTLTSPQQITLPDGTLWDICVVAMENLGTTGPNQKLVQTGNQSFIPNQNSQGVMIYVAADDNLGVPKGPIAVKGYGTLVVEQVTRPRPAAQKQQTALYVQAS